MLKVIAVFIFCMAICTVLAVDNVKFKKCADASFCMRQRTFPEHKDYVNYVLLKDTIVYKDDVWRCKVRETVFDVMFEVTVTRHHDGIVRLRVDEVDKSIKDRYRVKDIILEKAEQHVPFDGYDSVSNVFRFGEHFSMKIDLDTLRFDIFVDEQVIISVNHRGFLFMEHLREKPQEEIVIVEDGDDKEQNEVESEKLNEDPHPLTKGAWEDKFSTHTDTMKYGPQSIGLDISFIGSKNVYGIPEHATSLSLKETKGSGAQYEEPYRLYNLDVFEYELDNPMALYGSVPYLISHHKNVTVGMLWLNGGETWIDIEKETQYDGIFKSWLNSESKPDVTHSHWISETGIIDIFFLIGPKPSDVFAQYAYLTGTQQFPPMWAISYHQCRWNYLDQGEVSDVNENMDAHNIPCDCIWLDIEHTDGKKYLTWDNVAFPNPTEMIKNVSKMGRKMVTIVDPHIKKDSDYFVFKEAENKNYFVKDKEGKDYDGWCWPGSSRWLDFFDPEISKWWGDLFTYSKYEGSTPDLFTWNDMNEPSVFNGPEVTMYKDATHYGGWEHRDVHNIYGLHVQKATMDGLVRRNEGENIRPFVLSRAFYSGSQRYGAVWTGDNGAEWEHLEAAQPMLLTLGLTGIVFSGADVGGFFGNPEPELISRWYQAGALQPFFRAHAHLDTTRREPWVHGEPWVSIIRESVRTRYALLPYFYTLFFEASNNLMPVMRPLWIHYTDDEFTYTLDNQFLIGSDLLVKPIVRKGITNTDVYLPGSENDCWYDFKSFEKSDTGVIYIDTPLEKIPVFQRGGSIIPLKLRPRRSTTQMKNDPYTLQIALDNAYQATGSLFIDDENTFNYQNGEYSTRNFVFTKTETGFQISSTIVSGNGFQSDNEVERIIILGLPVSKYLVKSDSKDLTFTQNDESLTIKKPGFLIDNDWTISLTSK